MIPPIGGRWWIPALLLLVVCGSCLGACWGNTQTRNLYAPLPTVTPTPIVAPTPDVAMVAAFGAYRGCRKVGESQGACSNVAHEFLVRGELGNVAFWTEFERVRAAWPVPDNGQLGP